MINTTIETVTLPDGVRLSGYKGEEIFRGIQKPCKYMEQSLLEKWFLSRVEGIRCVYDIGANLGNHTVYFATHAKQAKVFSFEPMPVTFAMLKRNVEQNGLSDRVTLFPFALGAGESSAHMKLPIDNDLGRATITAQEEDVSTQGIGSKDTQEVSVKRLDDLNLPPPDFVKMDVERYELQVFKGMERTLREASPVLWIEILRTSADNQEKFEFLCSLGYLPIDISPSNLFEMSPNNFLFVKKNVSENEKLKALFAFIEVMRQEWQKTVEYKVASFESSHSWKITAPLRAVRGLFPRKNGY